MTDLLAGCPDTYALFAKYYDLEFASFDDDLELYRQFALEANGPILELGCGSGRVLAGLVKTGLPLTGVDSSSAMLSIARQRLGSDVALVRADMRDIDQKPLPNAPFWMAFSAINTFLHLEDADAQIRSLEALRTVVVPGGLLLLDLFVPDPHYLTSLDGRMLHEFTTNLPTADRLDKWVARTHDLASQAIVSLVWYDVTNSETGQVVRHSDQYVTRYIHRFELEHLLARAGWRVVSLFGTYDLEPYASDAARMIVLATWGEEQMDQEV